MPTTNEERALAENIINKAIQEVVFQYNAYAPIISSFRTAYTDQIDTMGVDKYARLVINPKFVTENEAYMRGVIIHEVLHVFFGHTSDTRSRLAYTDDADHNRLVNIAEDCAINQFINESLPQGAITPSELAKQLNASTPDYNETAEYYYDYILAHLPPHSPDTQITVTLSPTPCSTDQANTQRIQDLLDKMGIEHITQEEVNDKVLDTATQIAKAPGNQYGHLADFARQLLDPKVDWRPLLQATIRNAEKKVYTIHERSTYKRTSRRSTTILLPKKHGQKLTVALSFDTSGSITQDMVNQFLSEVQACLRYSTVEECSLWHTSNYWYGTPTELQKQITKIYESGGTDAQAMVNAEHHVKADLYIHFSDGYHDEPKGFKHPHNNNEIVWTSNNEIKEIRRF